MPTFPERLRVWLAAAGGVLALVALLPPVQTYVRHYAFVQALQFVIFAVMAPALLVLGRPWRIGAASAWHLPASGRAVAQPDDGARSSRHAARAASRLLAFLALVITWRLPAVVNAVARDPGVMVAEMVTLLAAGSGVWLELAGPANLQRRIARPLRAAMAAIAMWTIWVIAYVTGMSSASPLLPNDQVTRILGRAADLQLAVGIMWAVPAICFMPVIYGTITAWLGERDDPDQELRSAAPSSDIYGGLASSPRPPRGWRSPPPPQ